MIRDFAELIKNGRIPADFRDPQEFMFGEEHTEKSDVYALGMHIFSKISGRSWFECTGVPEDELFMMADPDSEKSVISRKFIPEEYGYLSELLEKMTVYSREARISLSEVLSELEKHTEKSSCVTENTFTSEAEAPEQVPEKTADTEQPVSGVQDRFAVEPDYDYGIILNNRRAGRIEFKPLLFHTGKSESYTVPVQNGDRFEIAVSKRHRDYAHISNPSSVYGDNIIPVGIACAEYINSLKTEISAENEDGRLKISFSGTNAEVRWC